MTNESNGLEQVPVVDDCEAMAAMLRAFQTRQVQLLTDAEAWAAGFEASCDVTVVDDEPPAPAWDSLPTATSVEREAIQQHLEAVQATNAGVSWSEEWLYPVDAWSLICGFDAASWEEAWQERVRAPQQEGVLDWSVLLQELERLRSLRILPSNEEGKIRRDDAVKVAYTLGYGFEPGTPGYDILIHRHGISPGKAGRRSGGQSFHPRLLRDDARHDDLVRAVVAALVLFPSLCQPTTGADLAQAILHTIRDKQILPPAFFGDGDTGPIEALIADMLTTAAHCNRRDVKS